MRTDKQSVPALWMNEFVVLWPFPLAEAAGSIVLASCTTHFPQMSDSSVFFFLPTLPCLLSSEFQIWLLYKRFPVLFVPLKQFGSSFYRAYQKGKAMWATVVGAVMPGFIKHTKSTHVRIMTAYLLCCLTLLVVLNYHCLIFCAVHILLTIHSITVWLKW